ncbi:MAG: ATP-binding cassette domain-containing protein [Pirellulaceae bacterium]
MSGISQELSCPFSETEILQLLNSAGELRELDVRSAWYIVAHSLDLKLRMSREPRAQILAICDECSPVLIRQRAVDGADSGDYIAVIKTKSSNRYRVVERGETKVVSRRWLRRNMFVGTDGLAELLTVSQHETPLKQSSETKTQHTRPFRRLLAFLRPEARDIRTVVIFSIFIGVLSLSTPLAVEAIVNTIAFGRYLQPLIVLSVIVLIFLLFQAGLRTLMTVVVEIIQRRLFVRTLEDLALRLPRVPGKVWDKYHGPELVNRFFDIVNVQKIVAKFLLSTLIVVLQAVIGMTVLAFYHPFLLGYDVGLILIMSAILIVMGRGATSSAIAESESKYKVANWLQELLRHRSAFSRNGGQTLAADRADSLAVNYINARRTHFRIVVTQFAFILIMQAIAATVLLGVGGFLVIRGQMTLGQLVAAELIVTVILGSFAKLGQDLESFYDLLASMDKLGKLFDLPYDNAFHPSVFPKQQAASVRLEGVAVEGLAKPLSVEIPANSRLALLGDSDSGRHEVIEVIAGGMRPESGYVQIDGRRVDAIRHDLFASTVGVASGPDLFAGSISENVLLGRDYITDQDLGETLKRLQLDEELYALPDSLSTKLNVGGAPLSGFLRCKIALARALASKPAILLIDGLLDGLSDNELEAALSALENFPDTTLVVATGRRRVADWTGNVIKLDD